MGDQSGPRFSERWHSWIERKGLPAHRIGKLWKFKLAEVDDWVRSGGANREDVEKLDAGGLPDHEDA